MTQSCRLFMIFLLALVSFNLSAFADDPAQTPPPQPVPSPAPQPQEPGLVGLRFDPAFGFWGSGFNQQAGGQSVRVPSIVSFGMEFPIGIRIGPVFLEYNMLWYTPSYYYSIFSNIFTGSGKLPTASNNDAVYSSLLGGTLGLIVPYLPFVEVFLGVDQGSYFLFNSPTGNTGGITGKLGFNLVYKFGGWYKTSGAGVGLRFEYRKDYIGTDQGGSMPSGVTTTADIYFIGLTTGFY